MIRNALKSTVLGMAGVLLLAGSGCSSTSLFGYIPAIPVERVSPAMLGRPREDMQEISLSRLRRRPPETHQLGPDDILAVYIETILPGGPEGGPPPTNFPDNPDQNPTIGYPLPVREDGTISLPFIQPLQVEGLSLVQATELIRKAYTIDRKLLIEGRDQISVALLQARTHQVVVVRQDTTQPTNVVTHVNKDAESKIIELPEGENDLLNALSKTGGLPGLDAQNEVVIIRSDGVDGREWDRIVAQIRLRKEPCACPLPDPDAPNVVRIPLRFFSEYVPDFTEDDIILHKGDIVMIQSREREKFYTGGVLGGGEFDLPRDYDLDIMGAIAIAGGPVGSSGAVLSQSAITATGSRGNSGGQSGGSGPLPPTDAIIIRKLCDGGQISIRVDLKRIFDDPRQRILIQPEDVIILRYKLVEEVVNTALGLIQFNFLFSGLSGRGL